MTTQFLDDTEQITRPITSDGEPGDHDLFAHYVTKPDLERAILDGISCRALCGKKWLPTRDAQKFPKCPECKDIFDSFPEA
jgi:hypothetical protein